MVTRAMVYMGGGPMGMAAATSAPLLGPSVVIVGDDKDRRDHNRSVGLETVDPLAAPLPEQVEQILGVPEVDAAVDRVGFAARATGDGTEQNTAALTR